MFSSGFILHRAMDLSLLAVTTCLSDTQADPNSQSLWPMRVVTGDQSEVRRITQSAGSLPPVAKRSPEGLRSMQ